MRFARLFLLAFTIAFAVSPLAAQRQGLPAGGEPRTGTEGGSFAGLRFRSIGPALTSGRIIAFAVDPANRARYFAAAASGGAWKTINAGTTWTPVFDSEASYSIGAVALDPANPSVVWVGTGECNGQRSVGWGDGVYKSEDGGRSWRNVGLKSSEHIGRIAIDPRRSDTVFVAAQGPLWNGGGDRGLYKTTDGGKTWKQSLKISGDTGVTDVTIDPVKPDIMYAAAWQRRRHVYTYIGGGPESALYRSIDGGETWTRCRAGLPGEDLGRIGVAVSPADHTIVYATVEAANKAGGVYRSTDFGATWEKRSDTVAQGMYYGQIVPDPKNPERVYLMDVLNRVSDDGGRTFRPLGEAGKHVDNHALWIDPQNTDYLLAGCDGGIYDSFDRGQTWNFKANLPIAQFYDLDVSPDAPFYFVYGGTQDNNSLGGPARSRSAAGITNADWFVTHGGDGFHTRVDPQDPNIVYATLQYGGVVRFDRRTGNRVSIQPQAGRGEPPLRWNWDSPLLISPHSHRRLYFAANRIYRSDDRGDSWTSISPDITRQLDRNALPAMGRIWRVDAVAKYQSTSFYGNITALAESLKKEGQLYAGTDDGLIQVTEDGGRTWRKAESFPGVPAKTYVSRLLASRHAADTVYAAFENHKKGDYKPYLLKSVDAGRTWTSIAGDMPAGNPALALAEDHVNPNLLFAGTEFGLYFTQDGGKKWQRLRNGLPTIAVRDIAIQRVMNDLVVATFGRGFYVLDDYSPLRLATPEVTSKPANLFPVRDALAYIPDTSRNTGSQGGSYFAAENPPFGATFTWSLKEAPKTRKQLRQEAEREAERKKEPPPYPTSEQLRAETEEEPPSVILTIADSRGKVIRRLSAPASSGVRRTTWDLRFPSVSPPQPEAPEATGGGRRRFGGGSGLLVMPGRYRVSLALQAGGKTSDLAGPVDFSVIPAMAGDPPRMDAVAVEFHQRVTRLQRAALGTLEFANALAARLRLVQRAAAETPAARPEVREQARALELRVSDILIDLRGDPSLRERDENAPPSIQDRLGTVVGSVYASYGEPTGTAREQYAIASSELAGAVANLRRIAQNEAPRLDKALDAAGAPWTPGRLPEWRGD